MRRGGKWRERVSCLISDEHQTQATPFFILSLSLSLSLFSPLSPTVKPLSNTPVALSANTLACIRLYPVVIDWEGTCRQLIELHWNAGPSQLLGLRIWRASTGRWREWLCSSRVLAGFHNSYEATAGWERLFLLWAFTYERAAPPLKPPRGKASVLKQAQRALPTPNTASIWRGVQRAFAFLCFKRTKQVFLGLIYVSLGLCLPQLQSKLTFPCLYVSCGGDTFSHIWTHINHQGQKVLAIQMVWISHWAHGHVGARTGRWVTSHSKENGILRKPLLWLASVYQKPIWWMKEISHAPWSFRIPCSDKRAIVLLSLIKNTELFI